VAETIDASLNQTDVTRFYHLDHLGSVETITDAAGLFAEGNSYDPWGKRRYDTTWADDPLELVTSETNRGFTSHEHLEEVALVHMNGRLYDAQVGRMLSADPFVQSPLNPQNFNRYTYVLNNPLAYTDPSGFFWKKALKWLGSPFLKVVNKVFGAQVASIVNLVVSAFCGPWAPACAAAGQFQIGIENGASFGQALKGAAIAAAGSYIAGGGLDVGNAYANVVVEGVARGGLSVAQGGKFGGAFASSVFAAGAGAVIPGSSNFGVEIARRAVIGGTSSVIGGGKFANGAKTAAFHYAASYGAGLIHNATRGTARGAASSQQKPNTKFLVASATDNTADFAGRSQKLGVVGTEFDKDNWMYFGEIQGSGNEIALVAGHQIALESSSISTFPTNQFWIGVSAYPIDSVGRVIPQLSLPGGAPSISMSSGFTGSIFSPNQFVIQSPSPLYASSKSFRWTVRIPQQAAAHGNAGYNTVRIFTRR